MRISRSYWIPWIEDTHLFEHVFKFDRLLYFWGLLKITVIPDSVLHSPSYFSIFIKFCMALSYILNFISARCHFLFLFISRTQNERTPSWKRTREKDLRNRIRFSTKFYKTWRLHWQEFLLFRYFAHSEENRRIGKKKSQMSININSSDSLITLLSLFHGRLLRFWSSDQNCFPSFKVKKFSLGMARILYPAGAPTGYPVEKLAG